MEPTSITISVFLYLFKAAFNSSGSPGSLDHDYEHICSACLSDAFIYSLHILPDYSRILHGPDQVPEVEDQGHEGQVRRRGPVSSGLSVHETHA